MMNTSMTSCPKTWRPAIAPYCATSGLSVFIMACENILEILIWIPLVEVLKFLQMLAISLEAKSRRAQ